MGRFFQREFSTEGMVLHVGPMKVFRSALVLLVTSVLSLSFTVPAEDLSETAYDESESLPYEGAALFSGYPVHQPVSAFQVVPTVLSDVLFTPRQVLRRAYPISSLTILNHSLRC